MGFFKKLKILKPLLNLAIRKSGKLDEINALGKAAGDLGGDDVRKVVKKIGKVDG